MANIFEQIIKLAGDQAGNDAKAIREATEKELRATINRKIKFTNPKEGKEMEKFSFARAIKGMVTGNWTGAEFEKTALTEGTNTNGGYLVPPEYSTQLIEMLYAKTVVRQAGATVIPMNSNVLYIPRQNGATTTSWVGEGTTITDVPQTFDQISLIAKKLVAMSIMSNELLYDSNPQVEAIIMNDLATMMAIAQDQAFIFGTGAANQPKGIVNQTGIGTVSAATGGNGQAPSYDNIMDALKTIQVSSKGNFRPNGILMHPAAYFKLMKTKDTAGRYLATGVNSGNAEKILVGDFGGIPIYTTTSIPTGLTKGTATNCSYMVVGQFDQALIGERKGIELFASNTAGTFFAQDVTGIRATLRCDFTLRHPEAFCQITDIDVS